MRKFLVLALVAVMCMATGSAFGQADQLQWFVGSSQVGPDNVTLLPANPAGTADPTAGALMQLIATPSGVINPAAYSGDGTSPDNFVLSALPVGFSTGSDGSVFGFDDFGPLTLAGNPNPPNTPIYLRVYDQPASTVGGDLPTPVDYLGDALIMGIYAADFVTAGTTVGVFYFDDPTGAVAANSNGASPSFFYVGQGVGSGGWTFLPSAAAVPEPGALAFLGIGGLLLGLRRVRKA